jgi:hypothetical protein
LDCFSLSQTFLERALGMQAAQTAALPKATSVDELTWEEGSAFISTDYGGRRLAARSLKSKRVEFAFKANGMEISETYRSSWGQHTRQAAEAAFTEAEELKASAELKMKKTEGQLMHGMKEMLTAGVKAEAEHARMAHAAKETEGGDETKEAEAATVVAQKTKAAAAQADKKEQPKAKKGVRKTAMVDAEKNGHRLKRRKTAVEFKQRFTEEPSQKEEAATKKQHRKKDTKTHSLDVPERKAKEQLQV